MYVNIEYFIVVQPDILSVDRTGEVILEKTLKVYSEVAVRLMLLAEMLLNNTAKKKIDLMRFGMFFSK